MILRIALDASPALIPGAIFVTMPETVPALPPAATFVLIPTAP